MTLVALASFTTLIWLNRIAALSRLYITREEIGCSNRLPPRLKFLNPEWRIGRDKVVSILADLGHGSGLKGNWRIRFMSEGKVRRSIPLLGWYRIDRDVEGQSANFDESAPRRDYTREVEALSVIAALKEAGFKVIVDAKPSKDTFSNTRAGMTIAIADAIALALTVIGLLSWRDLYATHAPWALILVIGGLSGILSVWGLRRTDIPREDKAVGTFITAALFSLAMWASAPLLNGMTSGGYQEIAYRYAGRGMFTPEGSEAPTLDLSRHSVSFKPWKPGDQVVLYLRHGALGFWQYDRDYAISALMAKTK